MYSYLSRCYYHEVLSMRYKVTCSYDGNNYVGFQSQKNGLAIQDVIEDVINKIFDESRFKSLIIFKAIASHNNVK